MNLPPARDRGSTTLEVALVLPLLLTMIVTIVQIAVWQHARHVAVSAARSSARAARVVDGSDSAGTTVAMERLQALGPTVVLDPRVTVSRDAQSVRVVIEGHAPSVLPGVRLPIRATAAGTVERFRELDDAP